MKVPKASEDLHGYHAWRRSLAKLEVGTIVKFNIDIPSWITQRDDIKKDSLYKIKIVKCGAVRTSKCDADLYYEMVLISKKGKEFKKKIYPSVEGIAAHLCEETAEIVEI